MDGGVFSATCLLKLDSQPPEFCCRPVIAGSDNEAVPEHNNLLGNQKQSTECANASTSRYNRREAQKESLVTKFNTTVPFDWPWTVAAAVGLKIGTTGIGKQKYTWQQRKWLADGMARCLPWC